MKIRTISIVLALSVGVAGLTAFAQTEKKTKKPQRSVEEQIDELRDSLQTQIDELKKELADRDAQLKTLQQANTQQQADVAKANAVSQSAAQSAQATTDTATKAAETATTAQATAVAAKTTADETAKKVDAPTAIHYRNVTITPKGFFAADSVWRQRAMNTDVSTPFNAIPYMNAGQAHISEFNGTGRQSNLGLQVQGTVPFATLTGYVETDFLGSATNSNNNESNSYVLRLRQAWGQAALHNGFTFSGGQMWSLVTETRHGVGPGGEMSPPLIDPQYHVGFSWARQYGVRASQQITPAVTVAASVEESQILFSAAGTTTANLPQNFFFGGAGAGSQNSTANYTDNLAPDLIVKAAYDPSFGHFEIGGIARFFRDRYYPAGGPANFADHTETGGGLIVNARVPATKYLDIGVHMMTGEGVGRYGTSQLPDVTVKPSGTLEPLRADQGLLTLIAHPTPKLDILGLAGGEYVQRTVYRNATNGYVGYAPPDANNSSCNVESVPTGGTGYNPGTGNATTCTGATRALLSGTVGWTYRFYNGTRGRAQYSVIYTYVTREAWAGVAGASVAAPKGTNNMIYTSFRYYLP